MNNLRYAFAGAFIALFLLSSPVAGQTAPEQQAFSYAQQLYQDGLYEIAIEQYRQYLANYPRGNQRPDAALQIAEAYAQLGEYEQALKAFLQVDLDYPGTDQALEGLWSVGESYEAMGQFEEAARAFNRLYVYYPDSERAPRALIRGGEDAQKAGNDDLAVELLQTAIDEYYQSSAANDARIQLAKVYRQQLEYRMAWTELERALNNANDKTQRGTILLEQAKTAENLFTAERAEALYQQIIQEYENSTLLNEARLELGRLAIVQKNYASAEEYLSEVENSENSTYRIQALEYHGDLFWQQQAYEDAKGYYMQALNLEAPLETRQTLFLKSALAAEMMGDYSQAYQQLQTITDRDVTGDIRRSVRKAAYDHLASSAAGIGRYRDALTALNNLKSLSPPDEHASIYHRTGDLYFTHLQDYQSAINQYSTLLDSFPRYPRVDDVFLNQGKAYLEAGDVEQSRQVFQWFINGYPYSAYRPDAESYLWYINHFKSPDQQRSFESLAGVIGDMLMERDNQSISFKLGKIFYAEQQNYDAAVSHFQSMLQQNLSGSVSDSVRWYLGESYRVLSRGERFLGNQEQQQFYQDRAIATYTELLSGLNNESPLRVQTIARISELYLEDNPQQAISFLTQQRTSENPELRMIVADAYQASGKTNEAFSALQSMLSNESYANEYPDALAMAASLAEETGNRAQAQDYYRRYLELKPDGSRVPEAQWALLQRAVEEEDYEQARNYAEAIRQNAFYTDYYARANNEIGQIYLETARYNEAAQWYTELANAERQIQELFIGESDLENPDPFYWAGYAYDASGQNQLAAQYYRRYTIEGSDPQKLSESYRFLADRSQDQENFSSAREYYLSASDLLQDESPEQANQLRVTAAEMLFKLEEYSAAEDELFSLVENIPAPRKYEIWEQAIIAQIRNGRISQANQQIDALRQAANLGRNDETLFRFEYEKSRMLAADKQFQESVPILRDILKREGRLSNDFKLQVKYELASQLRVTNNHEEAIKLIGEIVTDNPSSEVAPATFVTLGTIYAEMERRGDAIDAFKRALDAGARGRIRQSAMNSLMALYNSGQLFDAAISMAEQYIEEFPGAEDVFQTRVQIGVYQMQAGDYEEAIERFTSLLREADAETAAEIQYYVGEVYFAQNKYKQAITEYLKVPYLSPPTKLDWSASALWKAGNSYEELGSIDRAVQLYERIIREEGANSNFGRFARKRINELTMQGSVTPR